MRNGMSLISPPIPPTAISSVPGTPTSVPYLPIFVVQPSFCLSFFNPSQFLGFFFSAAFDEDLIACWRERLLPHCIQQTGHNVTNPLHTTFTGKISVFQLFWAASVTSSVCFSSTPSSYCQFHKVCQLGCCGPQDHVSPEWCCHNIWGTHKLFIWILVRFLIQTCLQNKCILRCYLVLWNLACWYANGVKWTFPVCFWGTPPFHAWIQLPENLVMCISLGRGSWCILLVLLWWTSGTVLLTIRNTLCFIVSNGKFSWT